MVKSLRSIRFRGIQLHQFRRLKGHNSHTETPGVYAFKVSFQVSDNNDGSHFTLLKPLINPDTLDKEKAHTLNSNTNRIDIVVQDRNYPGSIFPREKGFRDTHMGVIKGHYFTQLTSSIVSKLTLLVEKMLPRDRMSRGIHEKSDTVELFPKADRFILEAAVHNLSPDDRRPDSRLDAEFYDINRCLGRFSKDPLPTA